MRFELVFVIETDKEDPHEIVNMPWYPFIGEDAMPEEWLEYILVRPLIGEEAQLDFLYEDGINVIYEDREEELAALKLQESRSNKPDWLKLVVNNGDKKADE